MPGTEGHERVDVAASKSVTARLTDWGCKLNLSFLIGFAFITFIVRMLGLLPTQPSLPVTHHASSDCVTTD